MPISELIQLTNLQAWSMRRRLDKLEDDSRGLTAED